MSGTIRISPSGNLAKKTSDPGRGPVFHDGPVEVQAA